MIREEGSLVEPGLALPEPPDFGLAANSREAARWFGLHRRQGEQRFGFFVGVRRLPGLPGPPLRLIPRFADMDYAAMYAACTVHPTVSSHLSHVFHVWPEEPDVALDHTAFPWFTELLVIAFLRSLHGLCARHLRRESQRVRNTLEGRVKGRILIRKQLTRNIARHRPDRVFCEYGVYSIDSEPNRILRAALELGAARIANRGHQFGMEAVVRGCRAALAEVPVRRVTPTELAAVRAHGVYARYAEPLRLAVAVLRHLGLDPHRADAAAVAAPPFAMCTYELFERYVETRLRDEDPALWAGYLGENAGENLNGRGPWRVTVRPDFLGSGGVIYDAKYKFLDGGRPAHHDLYQCVAYSRHNGVKRELRERFNVDAASRIVLCYPDCDGRRAPEADGGSFDIPIFARRIAYPKRDATANE